MTAGWYDSGVDQNCHQGCAAHDLISVEADMNSHLHEVDTNAKLKAMIAAVGGTTVAGACSAAHSNNKDVPAWSPDACYIPNGKRSVKIEDCAAVASPLGHGKRRQCFCSKAALVSKLQANQAMQEQIEALSKLKRVTLPYELIAGAWLVVLSFVASLRFRLYRGCNPLLGVEVPQVEQECVKDDLSTEDTMHRHESRDRKSKS